ncbi:chemotaxis protein CheA [Tuberibacillus calidus]|uniref:chemotaxis protein CheA n=1 Tax=Tuberibacillus calidus TaxID=340097 RepID=UPI0003F79212|nr:chemotaxis protein CheA [Tuberibacillus calidus]
MDTNQYLDLFLDESREHLQNMNAKLLELENNPGDTAIVNEIFRSAHTLKGMSATMGYESMADLTHKLENVLDAIRHGERAVNEAIMDALFASVERLESMTEAIANGAGDTKPAEDLIELLLKVSESSVQRSEAQSGPNPEEQNDMSDYNTYEMNVIGESLSQGYSVFKIAVTLSESCLLKAARAYMVYQIAEQSGDIIKSEPSIEKLEEGAFDTQFVFTLITKEPLDDIKEKILKVSEIDRVDIEPVTVKKDSKPEDEKSGKAPIRKANAHSSGQSIRVNLKRIDTLMNLFEELVIEKGRLEGLAKQFKDAELTDITEDIARTTQALQDVILNLRMVPIEQVFNRFPTMVRNVSKELNKRIRLNMEGKETELDRTVIDEIGDPLVHLLRNSMDHGIETPEKRKKLGKPEEGTIDLKAYHSGNHVYIEIKDDGAGINREKVLNKAIKNGLINESDREHLSDQEVYQLLFRTGFSTADVISDISGRGVGLDVVKSKIESLSGEVFVESEENKGTTFTIRLPLTLSIITALFVQMGDEHYAIPLANILETAMVKEDDIMNVHEKEVLAFRDSVIPFIRLADAFAVPGERPSGKFIPTVIIRHGSKHAALAVDRLIGQSEIVIKPLGRYLGDVEGFSGATILGDGRVALIIDAQAFIH